MKNIDWAEVGYGVLLACLGIALVVSMFTR